MKKIIIFFLLVFSIFIASTEIGKADCENTGCDTTFTQERVLMEFPQFPGCTIEILYEWRRCADTIEINVDGFREPITTGPCGVLHDSLFTVSGTPRWDFLNKFLENARIELVKQYFMTEYNNTSPYDKYKIECPNGRMYFNYHWRKCTKWELVYQTIEVGEYTLEGWFFMKVDCESTACCEEQISICYNITTQQLEFNRALTSHVSGNCDNGAGTSTESGCTTPCEGIFIE